MTAKIQLRRDTGSAWTSADPTLAAGEIGFETDTNQIKVGNEISTWTALPYLGSTLPYFATATTDLNAVTVQGRYLLPAPSSLTNTPAAPIAMDTVSGGLATMLVLEFGTTKIQSLWTEGGGTTATPSRSWSRVYDGGAAAWREWVPQSSWGVGAADGTPLKALSVTVEDGTVGAPALTFRTDPNTGVYSGGADILKLATGGTDRVTIGSSGSVTLSSTLSVTGTSTLTGAATLNNSLSVAGLVTLTSGMAGSLDMNTNKVVDCGDPTAAQDAVTKAYLENQTRLGQTADVAIENDGVPDALEFRYQRVGLNTAATTFTVLGGTQLQAPSGQTWVGFFRDLTGAITIVTVTNAGTSHTDIGSGSGPGLVGPGTAHFFQLTRVS